MSGDDFSKLRTYIIEELVDEDVGVGDETSLFSTRIVNSRNLIQLVRFLEEEYELRVDPMDLTIENFDSIERIINYVTRKRS